MQRREWEIIHDCDDEDGNPTCWVTEINSSKYGKYLWISHNGENQFDVEVDKGNIAMDGTSLLVLATCKSLTSAKRWVATKF